MPYRYTSFPVVDEHGRAIGLVSVAQIEALAPAPARRRAAWARSPTATRSCSSPGTRTSARLLERPAFARVGRAVVVDEPGRPVGLVSITDVQRALRAARLV